MIEANRIQQAVDVLLAAAPTGSEVILFGSYARGNAHEDSDLDIMVVEPIVAERDSEYVRRRQILRPLRVPVDILVVSRGIFEAWKDLPNGIIQEAAREGRRYVAASAVT